MLLGPLHPSIRGMNSLQHIHIYKTLYTITTSRVLLFRIWQSTFRTPEYYYIAVWPYHPIFLILTMDKSVTRWMRWHGHLTRSNRPTCKTYHYATVPGWRGRGRPKTLWEDSIREWPKPLLASTLNITEERGRWSEWISYRALSLDFRVPV